MLAWKDHIAEKHLGVESWHFFLRHKYFIFGSRQLLKSLYNRCVKCKRNTAKPVQPIMSDLPKERVRLSMKEPPFTYVGIDLTGALLVKTRWRNGAPRKAYIVLYTCLTTRAIWCDITYSESADEFLLSFKRFMANEGRPVVVRTDSAGYFHKARKQLQECFANMDIALERASKEFEFKWIHNAELASHEGGCFERAIKSLKASLIKVCRYALLTHSELATMLAEACAVLNDRPLVANSTSETLEVITPSMLTRGRLLRRVPLDFENSSIEKKNDLKERWRHRNTVMEHFINSWTKTYLVGLQQRNKWFTPNPNLKVGDVVVLRQEKVKRNYWPLALVTKIEKGRNNAVRNVELRVPNVDSDGNTLSPSYLHRSVRHVCPLEMTGHTIEPEQ